MPDPAQHVLDFAKTHTAIIEQDRLLKELAIRPFTLEKLNLIQFGKVCVHQLLSESNIPNSSLS